MWLAEAGEKKKKRILWQLSCQKCKVDSKKKNKINNGSGVTDMGGDRRVKKFELGSFVHCKRKNCTSHLCHFISNSKKYSYSLPW